MNFTLALGSIEEQHQTHFFSL